MSRLQGGLFSLVQDPTQDAEKRKEEALAKVNDLPGLGFSGELEKLAASRQMQSLQQLSLQKIARQIDFLEALNREIILSAEPGSMMAASQNSQRLVQATRILHDLLRQQQAKLDLGVVVMHVAAQIMSIMKDSLKTIGLPPEQRDMIVSTALPLIAQKFDKIKEDNLRKFDEDFPTPEQIPDLTQGG